MSTLLAGRGRVPRCVLQGAWVDAWKNAWEASEEVRMGSSRRERVEGEGKGRDTGCNAMLREERHHLGRLELWRPQCLSERLHLDPQQLQQEEGLYSTGSRHVLLVMAHSEQVLEQGHQDTAPATLKWRRRTGPKAGEQPLMLLSTSS